MPLVEIAAKAAWENVYKGFPEHFWPGTHSWTPFANPSFNPSFKIKRGSKIFTMGSCFARNIEVHLERNDFDVVARRYFGNRHTINKYNTFSMLEAVQRVMGSKRLTPEQRFFQLGPDAWMDMHAHVTAPQPYANCLSDYKLMDLMYEEIVDCPYIVITLGLAEVWFDLETQSYMNEAVNFYKYYRENPELQHSFEGRFVFRVLDFAETYGSCKQLIETIRRASPNCEIIITVSPVPLGATFTGKDVLSANMYSKSVLRTAAEQIVSDFRAVDYFPSYESVMLSERGETWEADKAHVRDACVQHNIQKLLEFYVQ